MSRRQWVWTVLLSITALWAASAIVRPILPVDETRYLTVAWEMWRTGNWAVPHLNGLPYDHKPPLLFWLIQVGWWIGGVGEFWPRLIGPIGALVSALALERLAARLWPGHEAAGRIGTLIWLSATYMAVFLTGVMFDLLLLACVSAGWLVLHRAVLEGRTWQWVAWGVLGGLAILAKGPVALVYALPPVIFLRAWAPMLRPAVNWRAVAVAGLLVAALPLGWLWSTSPTDLDGYLQKVLFDQTAQRITGAMGHPRPAYWYVALLPLLLLPWSIWPPLWKAMRCIPHLWRDRAARLPLVTAASALIVLSLVAGKQPHYLIPITALLALLVGRLLSEPQASPSLWHTVPPAVLIGGAGIVVTLAIALGGKNVPAWIAPPPWWMSLAGLLCGLILVSRWPRTVEGAVHRMALAGVAFAVIAMLGVFSVIGPRYDLEPAARYIRQAQRSGRPIGYVGHYQGEFGFLGRLPASIERIETSNQADWLIVHPTGLLVTRLKRARPGLGQQRVYQQPYKTDSLVMYRQAETGAHTIEAAGTGRAGHAP